MFEQRDLGGRSFRVSDYGRAASVLHLDPDDEGQWADLLRVLTAEMHPKVLGPLARIFEVVRSRECSSVVIEHRYVDLDFRSEYAVFWAERFEFEDRRPLTRRLHFFACHVSVEDLHELNDDQRKAYLGYSVLRPTRLGPVGRTVVCPSTDVDDAVLTLIKDNPSLFGNELEVAGVPYCQQDGELLRCAHAAAWVCHYVAWRNGVIGRRFTGEIAALPAADGSPYRALPSTGLTSEQLQGIFNELRIPAIFYWLDDLPDLSAPIIRDDYRVLSQREQRNYDDDVQREQILRVVCKYLNSGFPVVVLSEDPANHAFTLVGWKHDGDRVKLIACDDQEGPYETIEDPLISDDRGIWSSIMLPLPSKVYLSADGAEIGAINMVVAGAERAAENKGDAQDADFAKFARHLERLNGPISIRTRLLQGRRFKESLAGDRHPDARRLYRMAHLPQYVWVVEFQDRAAREPGGRGGDVNRQCVLAEVVLDSTSKEQLPVAKLSSSLSLAKDANEAGQEDPALRDAPGPGSLWESLIVGRETRGTTTP